MIAGDNDILEVAVVESSFNVFYKLVLTADKNLVFVFWTWLVVFFRLAFLVTDVDIFDMTLLMFQHLQFFYFAAEVLMAPFYWGS